MFLSKYLLFLSPVWYRLSRFSGSQSSAGSWTFPFMSDKFSPGNSNAWQCWHSLSILPMVSLGELSAWMSCFAMFSNLNPACPDIQANHYHHPHHQPHLFPFDLLLHQQHEVLVELHVLHGVGFNHHKGNNNHITLSKKRVECHLWTY